MEGTQVPAYTGQAPSFEDAQALRQWRATAHWGINAFYDTLAADGLATALSRLPKAVQEDDIVVQLVEAIRHEQAALEIRKAKLIHRVAHLHDSEN
jgi:hypothetical protein